MRHQPIIFALCFFCSLLASSFSLDAAEIRVSSPSGAIEFKLNASATNQLQCAISFKNRFVIEPSSMRFSIDGVDLTRGTEIKKSEEYDINESYPWLGVHSRATNHCRGAKIFLTHSKSKTSYILEVRVFDDAAAFRYIVSGNEKPRVPDEATTFLIPKESVVWHHDLEGHYEGVHVRQDISEIAADTWMAPPITIKLSDGRGYASITEAALVNYSGMALQADGKRGLVTRLGHAHPSSYPFRLRYGEEEAKRLSEPAAISGTITTPWRVVLIGADLNAMVNADVVHNLCAPPDKKLFPNGPLTDWIKPGRAVWKYLDGGSNTFEEMKRFATLAEKLGFEHNIIEGFWSKWSDEQISELVTFSKEHGVGVWLWKHSKSLRDPEERRAFLERCHRLGITGVKLDFFDHEAKEMIDVYQSLLKETAENKLLVDFHGANKPTGDSRTWPNELTREAVKGMESSRLVARATHNVTLPFTRMLAGHAEYTVTHFGERRGNTTWAHQIASATILSAPLLTYAAHPESILKNPACEIIKSIPSTWDETIVLPQSEIGEAAVFARRKGSTWFLAVMNGVKARDLKVPLSFLAHREYDAMLVGDDGTNAASVKIENLTINRGKVLPIALGDGGGFIARFSEKKKEAAQSQALPSRAFSEKRK
jgi:alpha-glucosidase